MNRSHYGPLEGQQQVIAASILLNKTQAPRHLSPTHWGELVEESGITPAIAAANFRSFGALPFADPENERQALLAKRFSQLNPQPGHSFQARLKLQLNYGHLDAGGWRFIGDALPGYQPTPAGKQIIRELIRKAGLLNMKPSQAAGQGFYCRKFLFLYGALLLKSMDFRCLQIEAMGFGLGYWPTPPCR